MRKLIPAKKRIDVTPGESVRIIRELQGGGLKNQVQHVI